MTEISQEAVKVALKTLGVKSIDAPIVKAALQDALEIEEPRIQAQVLAGVKERLLSEENIDAMAALMCHYSSVESFRSHGAGKHGEEWGYWRRVEARLQLEAFIVLANLNPNGGES